MAEYLTNTSELTSVADAIRTKGRTSASLSFPAGFVSAINAIPTGYTADQIAQRVTLSGYASGNAGAVKSFAFNETRITGASFPEATTVGEMAFCDCQYLSEVNIPNILYAASRVFSGCRRLTSISFPIMKSISQSAFQGCGLINIAFPSVVSMSPNAFMQCASLMTAEFPLLSYVPSSAFWGDIALRQIKIPIVSRIYTSAFYACYNLLSVYLNSVSSVPTLSTNAFTSTPIGGYTTSTGGVYGSVYVPSSLYASFVAATNWKTISSRIVSV